MILLIVVILEVGIAHPPAEKCPEYLFELILLGVPLAVLPLWPVLGLPVLLGTESVICCPFLGIAEV